MDKDIVYLKRFLNDYDPIFKGSASAGMDKDKTIIIIFNKGENAGVKTYPAFSNGLPGQFTTPSGDVRSGWLIENKSDFYKGSTGSLSVTASGGYQHTYTSSCGFSYYPNSKSFTALAEKK